MTISKITLGLGTYDLNSTDIFTLDISPFVNSTVKCSREKLGEVRLQSRKHRHKKLHTPYIRFTKLEKKGSEQGV